MKTTTATQEAILAAIGPVERPYRLVIDLSEAQWVEIESIAMCKHLRMADCVSMLLDEAFDARDATEQADFEAEFARRT